MYLKGMIHQIVLWEKRETYFDIDDEEPHDLLFISNKIDKSKSRYRRYMDSWKSKNQKISNFTLDQGISIWIKRPHDYKVGDMIDIDIEIKKEEK